MMQLKCADVGLAVDLMMQLKCADVGLIAFEIACTSFEITVYTFNYYYINSKYESQRA